MSELLRIIAQGEGENLDFKFRIDDKRKIARTLAAFANTTGGTLLIGVKDNGKIKGVNPEEDYYMVEAAAGQYCQPELELRTKVWQEGHYLVLAVEVDPSLVKHKALDEEGKWQYFIRVADQTLRSNKIVERIWKLKSHGQKKPAEFSDRASALLALIRAQDGVSISSLYKHSGLKFKEVDELVSELVYWGAIQMDMSQLGTLYRVPK